MEVIHVRHADERPRSQEVRHVIGNRKGSFEPEPSLFVKAALGPEPEQRAGELHALLDERWRCQSPVERHANVVLLQSQPPQTWS